MPSRHLTIPEAKCHDSSASPWRNHHRRKQNDYSKFPSDQGILHQTALPRKLCLVIHPPNTLWKFYTVVTDMRVKKIEDIPFMLLDYRLEPFTKNLAIWRIFFLKIWWILVIIKNEKSSVYRWKILKIRLNFGKGSSPPSKKKTHWMETDN